MPPTVSVDVIATGDAGIMQTVSRMAGLIRAGVNQPIVIEQARLIAVRQGPATNQTATAIAIRNWLRQVWRYVDDPTTTEHLEDASYLLQRYQALSYIPGDCDEAAIMGATLGLAVGLTPLLTVLAFNTGADPKTAAYQHVYASLLTAGNRVVSLDVTKPAGPVAPVARALTVSVI